MAPTHITGKIERKLHVSIFIDNISNFHCDFSMFYFLIFDISKHRFQEKAPPQDGGVFFVWVRLAYRKGDH